MKKIILVGLFMLLAGCSSQRHLEDRGTYKADSSFPSKSQNDRVRFLVFHYTAVNDQDSLRILTQDGVSAHYLIPSLPNYVSGKPVILELVPEGKRAWHAGVSAWNGRKDLNDTSIGVEIVNKGFTERLLEKEWYPFNEQQIDLLARLAKDIIQRYDIEPVNVIGHSDIAPLRKYDPGKLFPWKNLAEQGIGAWPDDVTVEKYMAGRKWNDMASVALIQKTLAKYGYTIPQTGVLDEDTLKTISAFQMHFRPDDISGNPDAQTESIALALVEKYKG
ncbi:N-acetylmuramoyl-L-alanine amidase [Photorhabdus temperata]|uniref:N-acetylmuramoyl-L-alanine amidase n=2 Tax=Photorhabdus temperata TaxID=574560 RepID=A0A081RTL5_PHOTE|nr:N-acetylmuramoyl-L-alanine amidase [Photorhabdus temperata]EQB99169.1 N-acetylmuramoyl-L-alanine amidase [Photorhabdus temperata subsp. temperata M1021]ERT10729.1 N-acetylmuramoyl-L-alanine amidase [Photorhabdus temperata J3]KER02018.1 negative regulator of beta-lactamase expression [Photorhabdus temperata subsp. temperata Meg1]MCT8347168.1 N-acetylmuramoyl-L-alanine amidase [Photorhabdus temperata]